LFSTQTHHTNANTLHTNFATIDLINFRPITARRLYSKLE